MTEKNSVQNKFLAELCESQKTAAIYLINGIKLHGIIGGFDDFTIYLKEPTQQIVTKSAVATVLPLEH
jgi:host factor-I protein